MLGDDAAKSSWVATQLPALVDAGDVIVFAGQRARVDSLTEQLKAAGVRVGAIHGEMDQVGPGRQRTRERGGWRDREGYPTGAGSEVDGKA